MERVIGLVTSIAMFLFPDAGSPSGTLNMGRWGVNAACGVTFLGVLQVILVVNPSPCQEALSPVSPQQSLSFVDITLEDWLGWG